MSAWNENWKADTLGSHPLPATPCRGDTEEQLERLKERLLRSLLAPIENAALVQELRWVANEAAALAWLTVCPALVLPTLLEEKISAACARWDRQQYLWKGQKDSRSMTAGAEQKSVLSLLAPLTRSAFPLFPCSMAGPLPVIGPEAFVRG